MNTTELRSILSTLGLSQGDLARLILTSPSAVNLRATGEQVVPGPVAAYLRLILSLSPALQAKEISRLGGETMSIDACTPSNSLAKTAAESFPWCSIMGWSSALTVPCNMTAPISRARWQARSIFP
jgi:hypothetical protein